jgi:hypothetical protein
MLDAESVTLKSTVFVPPSPSVMEMSLIERVGCGACTTVVTVAELFATFASGVFEAMLAVLVIVVPAVPFAVATRVIVSKSPLARAENVIVRLFPEPPQTPPPVDEQETKLTVPGRLSVSTTA